MHDPECPSELEFHYTLNRIEKVYTLYFIYREKTEEDPQLQTHFFQWIAGMGFARVFPILGVQKRKCDDAYYLHEKILEYCKKNKRSKADTICFF